VALGVMRESVDVSGGSNTSLTSSQTPTHTILLAGIPLVVPTGTSAVTTTTSGQGPGGLFAQPTNIGHHARDRFAVVPEGKVKLGYQITNHWGATIGYSFFLLSDVARPGAQIDRSVNSGLLASPSASGGSLRPQFVFRSSDFWAQGVDIGLEFRY
jgi:hypothetical protein